MFIILFSYSRTTAGDMIPRYPARTQRDMPFSLSASSVTLSRSLSSLGNTSVLMPAACARCSA